MTTVITLLTIIYWFIYF